jgi:DNA-binding IclR family transcriptional regulator
LTRAAQVIDVVAAAADGLPLHRISEEVGLPASTTHRLVRSLVAVGYLAGDEGSKTYRLGRRLMRVFHAAFGRSNIQVLTEPMLNKLVQKFEQVFYVNQLVAGRVRLAAFVIPNNMQRALVVPGEYSPMHATAMGKAIFAYETEGNVDKQLSGDLEKFQPATIVEPDKVRAELARVRERGYATSKSEYEGGVTAIAVPVEIPKVGVTIAIGAAGLDTAMFQKHSLEDYVAALREAATGIQVELSLASR